MAKAKGAKLGWEARAGDLLAGRTKLDALELLDLIHEVNPTGRGRHDKESAARYVLKARLQSLLIDRFGDVLTVAMDGDEPGVVSIRHRSNKRDACHAVIDSLDDQARSWVRLQIDLGPEPGDAELRESRRDRPSRRGGGPVVEEEEEAESDDPELLAAAAARAEEAYDFDLAGRLFRRAFEEARDAATGIALVRFLVDAIAADEEALATYRELPSDGRANGLARALAGLAAARLGDDARAVDLAAHADDRRAADALTLVARHALAKGDDESAAARLREAALADPAHPDIRGLEDEVKKLRLAARATEERFLEELLEEGNDDAAWDIATRILAHFPESEPARRAAADIDTRRRASEGKRLLGDAEEAHRRGDTTLALAMLVRALETPLSGPDRTRAVRMSDDIARDERKREAEAQADRVAAALGAGDEARALLAYAELDDPLRARVRARVEKPSLAWIDAIAAARSVPRAKAVVEAVMGLERAAPLEGKDAGAVLALLSPHERVLEPIALARTLLEWARAERDAVRRRAAEQELDAAERAVHEGDFDKATLLLDHADRELDGPNRERCAALRAQIVQRGAESRLIKRFERARGSHQYRDAIERARELATRAEGTERERWLREAEDIRAGAQRELDIRVHEVAGGSELARGVYVDIFSDAPSHRVDLESGLLWFANGGQRLFLRAFDIDTQRLVRTIELVPPDRSDEPQMQLSGESLLVLGGGWGMMEISKRTTEPIRWVALSDPVVRDVRCAGMLRPDAGSRYLWHQFGEDATRVLDLEGERPMRELAGLTRFMALPGTSPPKVAALTGAWLNIYEASGHRVARFGAPGMVHGAAALPDVPGYFAIFERGPEDAPHRGFAWGEISPTGEMVKSEPIDDIMHYPVPTIARASDDGLLFARFRAQDTVPAMIAFGRDPATGDLRVLYRVSLGERRVLATDEAGKRAFITGETDAGVEIIPLRETPPEIHGSGTRHALDFPLNPLLFCLEPRESGGLQLFVKHFKWTANPLIHERAVELERQANGERGPLLTLAWGLLHSNGIASAQALANRLVERFPDDPAIRDIRLASLAAGRNWEELKTDLAAIDGDSLAEDARRHFHHLRAAAHLGVSDVVAATLALGDAEDEPGACKLTPLRAWLEALSAPQVSEVESVPLDLPTPRQLVALVRAADSALARDDFDAVLALFERALPWEVEEAQLFARLAKAHLARPAPTSAERLRKAIALENWLNVMYDPRVGIRNEVIVPDATWPTDVLNALAKEARLWLTGPRSDG